MRKKLIRDIERKARKLLDTPSRCHDWEHTQRVHAMAMHIASKERADREVVAIAAFLHDVGRYTEDTLKGRVCHAEIGARMAGDILAGYELSDEKRRHILDCIATHRYRTGKRPQTLEAKIIFDADKLDAIGAIGIGRAFQFAGEVGAKLHDPDIDVAKTKSYTKEDTAYREYLVKLRFVRKSLYTGEGKRIARGRHQFMDAFFKRLNREVRGEI